jgi:hypothetical protein
MTPAERRDIATLLRDSEPPPSLRRRMGPPLAHPLDPRHAYRLDEAAVMTELADADAAGRPGGSSLTYAQPTDRILLRAAETHARYRSGRKRKRNRDTP